MARAASRAFLDVFRLMNLRTLRKRLPVWEGSDRFDRAIITSLVVLLASSTSLLV